MRIRVCSYDGKKFVLYVPRPRDMKIIELKEEIAKSSLGQRIFELRLRNRILKDFETLESYRIKDNDQIFMMPKCAGGGGSEHLCPYGCGRMIPDEFKGCTELLQARPNYFNKWKINYIKFLKSINFIIIILLLKKCLK